MSYQTLYEQQKDKANKLTERIKDLQELNSIYVDFLVEEGYELSEVMGK